MITSVKMSATVSAISTLTSVLAAMTPPNADERIALVGLAVRIGDRHRRDRDAARVGVLDDGHAGLFMVERGAPRRVGIGEVVVGHLFSVQLLGLRQTLATTASLRYSAACWCGFSPYRSTAARRQVAPTQGGNGCGGSSGASTDPIHDATAMSYSAVCRNANDASFFRSSSVNPPARTAASTPS